MSEYRATCLICGHVQLVYSYDDWTCEDCGQVYEYDEGHSIKLSAAQVAALRALAGREAAP